MLAVLAGLLGRWQELWRELRSRRLLVMLTLSTASILSVPHSHCQRRSSSRTGRRPGKLRKLDRFCRFS
jgi:hypothetical protein